MMLDTDIESSIPSPVDIAIYHRFFSTCEILRIFNLPMLLRLFHISNRNQRSYANVPGNDYGILSFDQITKIDRKFQSISNIAACNSYCPVTVKYSRFQLDIAGK